MRRWEDNIKTNLNEISINTRNWVDSVKDWDYWRAPCECGIEPTRSVSHGVSQLDIIYEIVIIFTILNNSSKTLFMTTLLLGVFI